MPSPLPSPSRSHPSSSSSSSSSSSAPPSSAYDIRVVTPEQDTRRPEPSSAFTVYWHPLFARAAILCWRAYFALRLLHLLAAPEWRPLHFALLFAEHAIQVPSLAAQALTVAAGKAARARPRRPLLRLHGRAGLPVVDILVPCCREEPDLILNTVRAAASQDYPSDCFRVVVLDDGASDEVRDRVAELSALASNVHYSARLKESANLGFSKAGNLNHALLELHDTRWPAPELVAVVDADFIVEPHFLRSTLPHLLQNPKQAMISTPQHFYNVPTGDPLLQALDYGTAVLEPIQDRLDHATCSGSGFVFKRNIVMGLGGFPMQSFNEDVLLSSLLLQAGWHISHPQEVLQFGTVPTSFSGHVSQRTRWIIGVCQLMGAAREPIHPPISSKQRREIFMEGFHFTIHLFSCATALVIAPVALFSGQPLLSDHSMVQFKLLCSLSILLHLFAWIHEWMTAAGCQFFVSTWPQLNQIWITPLQCYGLVKFLLLGQKRRSVMGIVTGQKREERVKFWKPSRLIGGSLKSVDGRVLLYVGLVQGTTAALIYSVYQCLHFSTILSTNDTTRVEFDMTAFVHATLTRFAFPPAAYLTYVTITQCWVPISFHLGYTTWPSPSDALEIPRNSMFGAKYPTRRVKDNALKRVRTKYGQGGHYVLVVLALGWAVFGLWAL